MKPIYLLLFILSYGIGQAQSANITLTKPEVDAVLRGNFDPEDYAPTSLIEHPEEVVDFLRQNISADSLRRYLEIMGGFGSRNTGSDTASTTFGIGAARRWGYQKFEEFSAANENRLLVSYLQFDRFVCGATQHRNVLAVLPGVGPKAGEVVLVEGHLDSRCADRCDTDCNAEGIEDNASGSALVLELARVMAPLAFNRTLVFLLTTGEEQGLIGAEAFADYCVQESVALQAVFNNDIVGGTICGTTASPPGCPGLNHVDSINVRIYSSGTTTPNKQLARFTSLQYREMAAPLLPVANVINIMTPEDRSGRGGDHIPFRERGFPAIRFTAANEHGDGNPSQDGYDDRQHTVEDILGVDTDGDQVIDSFFIDFNYLARNTLINGNAIAMAAAGPVAPYDLTVEELGNELVVSFQDSVGYGNYRLFIRTNDGDLDIDSSLALNTTSDTLRLPGVEVYYFSACAVDSNGIESLFTEERQKIVFTSTEEILMQQRGFELLQNRPNPFDEATTIGVYLHQPLPYREAFIEVSDLQGRRLAWLPIELKPGINEVLYDYQSHSYQPGTYAYSLWVDGKRLATKRMIYAY